MIRTVNLHKTYGTLAALVDFNLTVERGEVFGLLGPNGAGKSTLLRILTGLMPPTSGSATIGGADVSRDPLRAKAQIGYVPETPFLYEELTPTTFLALVAALRSLDPQTGGERAARLFDLLELAEARHRPLRDLSKGMRQKVVLAAALVHNPAVLVLDEPFDGLDAVSSGVLHALLTALGTEGRTILIASHQLERVETLCTRVCVVRHGRAVATGTPAEITRAAGAQTFADGVSALLGASPASQTASSIVAALRP